MVHLWTTSFLVKCLHFRHCVENIILSVLKSTMKPNKSTRQSTVLYYVFMILMQISMYFFNENSLCLSSSCIIQPTYFPSFEAVWDVLYIFWFYSRILQNIFNRFLEFNGLCRKNNRTKYRQCGLVRTLLHHRPRVRVHFWICLCAL